MADRIVLAYSGGLDTSVAVAWLTEKMSAEVVAVTVDVGQGGEDLDVVRQRALACGAAETVVVDVRDQYAERYCMPALLANGLYMDRYPLISALSRPLIAEHLIQVARRTGAGTLAHGCTGKGNDQARFEISLAALGDEMEIIAPTRDTPISRDFAIGFAAERGLPIEASRRSPYSIDQNMWGRTIEAGPLEDTWAAPMPDIWNYTRDPDPAAEPDEVTITFEAGLPTALDDRPVTPREAIEQLNVRAGRHGVGRLDMMEDRLVGIKTRECYEAPGAITLITAHRELESLTLEKELLRYKRGVDQRWAELVYDGLWFSPLKGCLDDFVAGANRVVTGRVRLRLHAGQAVVVGRDGEGSLYDLSLASYGAEDRFDQSQARGFLALWGLPTRLAARRDARLKS